ncbi:MAG TPA: DUF2635 domain-containing protein [Jiangellaceae bacterium]
MRVSPGTPGPSIPVTDVKTGMTHGSAMVRSAAEAGLRRDRQAATYTSAPADTWPAVPYMTVKPATGRVIYDIEGNPYPPEGVQVSTSDVYAHRRLRDGSLVLVP